MTTGFRLWLVLVSAFAMVRVADAQIQVHITGHNQALPLTDATADNIIMHCNKVLAANNCGVRFQRAGGVQSFAGLIKNGEIADPPELRAIDQLPENVKAVRFISYCDGNYNGDEAGCSGADRRMNINVALKRRANSLTALNWLHEYGHNCGLGHSITPGNIMYDGLGPRNRDIDGNQCAGLHERTYGGTGGRGKLGGRS